MASIDKSQEIRELVADCLSGSQTAMMELVDRYRGQVFGLCYRMLGHRQDAEDMAQETFVRLLKSLDRWDPERDFEPWLLAIAGNRCRTQLAKRMRRPPGAPLDEHLPDSSPDFQAARDLAEEVDRAFQSIRQEYRQAFTLFHQHELSYAEIAEAMSCPLGTVKTWVHRARKELIACLQQRGVVQEPPHVAEKV